MHIVANQISQISEQAYESFRTLIPQIKNILSARGQEALNDSDDAKMIKADRRIDWFFSDTSISASPTKAIHTILESVTKESVLEALDIAGRELNEEKRELMFSAISSKFDDIKDYLVEILRDDAKELANHNYEHEDHSVAIGEVLYAAKPAQMMSLFPTLLENHQDGSPVSLEHNLFLTPMITSMYFGAGKSCDYPKFLEVLKDGMRDYKTIRTHHPFFARSEYRALFYVIAAKAIAKSDIAFAKEIRSYAQELANGGNACALKYLDLPE